MEAVYKIETEESEWQRGVAATSLPLVSSSAAVAIITAGAPPRVLLLHEAHDGGDGDGSRLVAALNAALERRLPRHGCLTRVVIEPSDEEPRLAELADAGIRELWLVDAAAADLSLVFLMPRPCAPTDAERAQWERLAGHLATAQRLRRRERAPAAPPRERPNAAPSQPEWSATLAKRWRLVDHFDSEGHRYLLVRLKAPGELDFDCLTARERQVVTLAGRGETNKEIAYSLSISASTVGVLLTRAVKRCGFADRKALLEAFARRTSTSAEAPLLACRIHARADRSAA